MEKPINKCEISFQFRCPMAWGIMLQTEDERTRFCYACNKYVYYVEDYNEAQNEADKGNCIAWNDTTRDESRITTGLPVRTNSEVAEPEKSWIEKIKGFLNKSKPLP